MKILLPVVLSLLMSASNATGYDPVLISGSSTQTVTISNSTVSNVAFGNSSVAQQNLASNTGGVVISGSSLQVVSANGSFEIGRASCRERVLMPV